MGRDPDLAVIRAFAYELSAQGSALLLAGEPGVGKSALLEAAGEIAAVEGIRVLRAAGAEFEDVGFSGLNQLLRPLRGHVRRLDIAQRNALNVALGFIDGPARDPLVVSNAALALLSHAAADRPLLLIIDDLQWVDSASAVVLGLIARRLSGTRIGLLAASGSRASRLSDLEIPAYEVQPLGDDASMRLVADSFPDLAPGVRQRIVTEASGNPLALLELPAGLSHLQRASLAPLPMVLPLSRRLQAVFSSPISALPAATRYLLLLAVLEGTGDLSLARAAAGGQSEIDDLIPAEQAGLVRVDESGQRVTFAHPLIRSAVLELSASGDVRRGYRALAAHLAGDPERQAWHLAGAATQPDEGVASQLEQVARQMLDRGAANRAVTALLRAAQLSPEHRDRSRRLAEAACLSATVTAELPVARQLLTEARRDAVVPSGSLSSDVSLHAAVADAHLTLNSGEHINTVHRLLASAIGACPAARQSHDAGHVRALHALLMVCADGGRPELWTPFEDAVASLAPASSADLEMLARTHADPARSALGVLAQLDAAIADLSRETGHWRTLIVGAAAAYADRLPDCREALRRVAHSGLEGGAVLPAINALTLLCLDGFLSGAWDEAWQAGEECIEACQSYGYSARAWTACAHLALIAAARGDDEVVRERTDEILRWAAPRGITLALMAVQQVGSLAALGHGNFEEAYRAAAAISPPGTFASHVPHALWTLLDLVEAAVYTGRQREAAAHVAAAREARLAEISPRLALLVTTSAALAAPAGQADRLFQQALAIPGADRWPFEFARAQLVFGERLRRARARGEARDQLAAAFAAFHALGARSWAERAARELRATGLGPAKTENLRFPMLTAQEHKIVSLAAAGLSNKEIGQRLFLSPRTVGSHLYRVFPKLGVSSRAGLRDALTALAPADDTRDAFA